MPIFEFSCQKCGHSFEELLPSAEFKSGDVQCPSCGARQAKRALSTFASGRAVPSGGGTPCGGGGCGTGGGFT